MPSPIGSHIHVVGNTAAGKSTLGTQLAEAIGVPFVELDALNWQPNWVGLNATDPARFEACIAEATAGDGWVVAGSYMAFSERVFWDRLETAIWLDLPLPLVLRRVVTRSWRRWRSREHLWGTNYESFWGQLAVWRNEDSLIWWAVTQHPKKRRSMLAKMTDPRWSHIRFIRLTSEREIDAFRRAVEEACRTTA